MLNKRNAESCRIMGFVGYFILFKGTVSVISSDPSYKDVNARFATGYP